MVQYLAFKNNLRDPFIFKEHDQYPSFREMRFWLTSDPRDTVLGEGTEHGVEMVLSSICFTAHTESDMFIVHMGHGR